MGRAFVSTTCVLLVVAAFVGCGSSGNDAYDEAEKAYRAGKYEKAVELFTEAAKHSDNPAIYGNRGNCYSALGNLDAAIKDYDTAIKKAIAISGDKNDPNLAYFYYNRGFAYQKAGKPKNAIAEYERTIEVNGEYPDAKGNLAWLLATCVDKKLRNPRRAIVLAEGECKKTNWKNAGVLDTLSAAYAANGDFQQAIDTQQKAIDLNSDAQLGKSLKERLDLYRDGKPYVDLPEDESSS